jgi:hypothetical protein
MARLLKAQLRAHAKSNHPPKASTRLIELGRGDGLGVQARDLPVEVIGHPIKFVPMFLVGRMAAPSLRGRPKISQP